MIKENMRILPVHKRDVTSGITDRILAMIGEGYWQPGDCLPSQRELAKSLEVSLASLRESLHSLQTIGVLEMRHGSGTFITSKNIEPYEKIIELNKSLGGMDLKMFFEARGIIETGLAALAAEHGTDEQIEDLFKILQDQLVIFDTHNNGYYHDLDLAFHQLIAEMANNPLLAQINETLFRNLEKLFRILPLTRKGWQLHQNVAEAIRDRSPLRASEAMRTLIGASFANYLPSLKND